MRSVMIFCEGNHDVVFTARSLGVLQGAEWIGNPIRDLPSPFGQVPDPANPRQPKLKSLIAQRYSARSIDELRIQAAAHPPLPSFEALLRVTADDTLFVLVRSSGDGASVAAIELLRELQALLLPAFNTDVSQLAAVFLFDADVAGVASREATFATDYATILDGAERPSHAQWVNGKEFPVGLYVFHDRASGTGTLEDILAPLVKNEWTDRWHAAESYVLLHEAAGDPVAIKPAERQKAQICITGQFRCPGDPMTEVIGRNGLPQDHFTGSQSQALVDFLNRVPWP